MSNLARRWLSAALMIPAGLFVVWSGGLILAAACAAVSAIMAYEWASMAKLPLAPLALAAALPSAAAYWIDPGAAVAVLAAGALSCAALIAVTVRPTVHSLLGPLYVGGMGLGLYLLRDGPWDGVAAALILMSITWASDAGGFFAGRTFGGPSLSPESPNKTWSGAAGSVVAVLPCGALASYILDASLAGWLFFVVALSLAAQLGDLLESGFKRRFGAKDSSDLIPGHGGVMDRVDGLGFVCLMAVAGFLLVPRILLVLGLDG